MTSSLASSRLTAHPPASPPAGRGGGPPRTRPAFGRGPLAVLVGALGRLYRTGRGQLLAAVTPTTIDREAVLRAAGHEFRHLVHRWPTASVEDVRWEMTLAARLGQPVPRADRPSRRR